MKKIYLLFILSNLVITSCTKIICNDLVYDNGVTKLNGVLFSGNCKSYFFTGELKSIEKYLDGLDHGKWIFYFINGNIQTQGEFNKGKRIGSWKYFFEDKSIWKIHNYDSFGSKKGDWIEYNKSGDEISKKIYF